MTKLVIIRHGNTFEAGEIVRRVGARTDLSLTAKGLAQAESLVPVLKIAGLIPDKIFSGPLQRTLQTAKYFGSDIEIRDFLREIDYGPDENKPEADVITRIGKDALQQWEEHACPPEGWHVDVEGLKQEWQNFADEMVRDNAGKTIFVVTSNGIARFALDLIKDDKPENLKLATGAFGVLMHDDNTWQLDRWNIRP